MSGTPDSNSATQLSLIRLGAALFLLGLLTGLVATALTNPRMGLSAHLEGVMNGIFLIALGAVWAHIRLGPRTERLTFWLLAYGTTVNWATISLAALWGTGTMTPIAAPGLQALPWQEGIVTFGLLSVTLAMILGVALVVWGAFRRA